MRTRVAVLVFALMFVSDGAGEATVRPTPSPTLNVQFSELQGRIDAVEVLQYRIERTLKRRGK